MRDEVIKKLKFDSEKCWCDNNGSYYAVKINHCDHTIEFEDLGGGSPDWTAFKNFCLSDTDMIKELKWASTQYIRKYPVYVKDRVGMSGCRDISLHVSKSWHEWAEALNAKKVLTLHISCWDKLNEGIPDMFSGDLLELLAYEGGGNIINSLGKEDRKFYKYLRKTTPNMKRINSVCGSI